MLHPLGSTTPLKRLRKLLHKFLRVWGDILFYALRTVDSSGGRELISLLTKLGFTIDHKLLMGLKSEELPS